MKLLVVFTLFVAVYTKKLSPEVIKVWEGIVAPLYDDCVKITNVDPEIPKTMFELEDLPNADSFICYMKCIYDKLSFLKPNGELDQDQMLKVIYTLKLEELQKCIADTPKSTDLCKNTHDIAACIIHRVEND
ncbi:hypothetical protein PPYR_06498 [Photinus pyralis]|uniref:Uncharacterized protein n=1 Tax=Photinus pyralis TaxID=7054 RepID=A0A5N4ATW5_PHOPY|nr:uncharacterized protein LOC116167275 [Photinus pyralis]XP_031345158.1 uncharacterized protein LOC116172153 [Photinus pyralis]KAB0800759.1 hypothetical protein PPYR_06498 [Photinus pyralis]